MLNSALARLEARSIAIVNSLDGDLRKIMLIWTVGASLACGIRIAATAHGSPLPHQLQALAPYALVVGAPLASLMLALHWFRDGSAFAQPRTRFAHFGQWRSVPFEEASRHRLYGVSGIMASLLLGMLVNVPVRSLEFLASIPAVTAQPVWMGWLSGLMLADVVLLTSLYCVAFAAALRRVPYFPRLLACIWAIDIGMQHLIARVMSETPGLPPRVGDALHGLLEGNVKKVLISLALWMPYLLLSKRVNITFRHRLPAD